MPIATSQSPPRSGAVACVLEMLSFLRDLGFAGSLRSPEEMAVYLEACIEEADGGAALIAKALGATRRLRGCRRPPGALGSPGRSSAKHSLENEAQKPLRPTVGMKIAELVIIEIMPKSMPC